MPEIISIYCILIFLIPAFTAQLILLSGKSAFLPEFFAILGMIATFIVSTLVFVETQSSVLTLFDNNLRIDSLSGLVSFLISLIGLIVIIYSTMYIRHEKSKGIIPKTKKKAFYWQVMLFIATMIWATTTNNIIMLWVIIEATTLASAVLVAFYWNKDALEAGYKYLMLLTVGISFALFGCILLYSGTAFHSQGHDPLQITVISQVAKQGVIPASIIMLSVAFLIVGFGTKAGIAPFHAWLPDAHAEAPTPVSALLSGIMIKVGIYALVRTITMFYSAFPAVSLFVVILGIFTMILGVLMMFIQEDLKRFLAYSSVSQIGYIIMGLGFAGFIVPVASDSLNSDGAYLGMYGSIFHLINHALIKSLLFLCVGAILYATGIRRIHDLGGLGKKMPVTSFCFIVAVMAISGIPLLNGFMSKFTLFLAGVKIPGMLWATVIAIICSILTLATTIHVFYRVFMGPMPDNLKDLDIKEVPFPMSAAMFILVLLCFVIGIYPQIIYPMIDNATNVVLGIITKG
jgi:hydrogenase-4 component F